MVKERAVYGFTSSHRRRHCRWHGLSRLSRRDKQVSDLGLFRECLEHYPILDFVPSYQISHGEWGYDKKRNDIFSNKLSSQQHRYVLRCFYKNDSISWNCHTWVNKREIRAMNIKMTVWTSKFRRFLLQKPIDGKTLISFYLHICIIFHHNLWCEFLLKWDDEHEPQNLSIGNVVKLKNPVAVGQQIFS